MWHNARVHVACGTLCHMLMWHVACVCHVHVRMCHVARVAFGHHVHVDAACYMRHAHVANGSGHVWLGTVERGC